MKSRLSADMLRARDEQLWEFLAEQHRDFHPEAWYRFDVVDRIDLALYAAYLSMGDWYGHFESLHQIAETLVPGITELETFTRRAMERTFDLTRSRYMLQSEIGSLYHGTPYWKPERQDNPLPVHAGTILRETVANLDRGIKSNGYQGEPIRMNIVGDMAHWRQTGEGHPLLIECWFSLRVLWNGCSIWIAFRHVDPLDYDERQAIRWPEIEPKGSVVEAYTAVPAGLSG